ncbi:MULTISPECIES: hypothetical protein [Pseudomonas syringae group]|uniref:hypothetical protein n=1 Tax=Pseudomonas syringae group TaxID=136849 RepID=UPI001365D72B|nr:MULTISPECIES: hypothetical protein [Pseudomonas syringae group]MDU8455080.1 hypothetical protein [Pseudomonas syringae group sp. J254-4]
MSNFFIGRCAGDGCARNSLLMRTKANNVYLMNFSQFRKKDGAWLSGWGGHGFAGQQKAPLADWPGGAFEAWMNQAGMVLP